MIYTVIEYINGKGFLQFESEHLAVCREWVRKEIILHDKILFIQRRA